MTELFKMLDVYRETVTEKVDLHILTEKQETLGVVFPDSMVDFYRHFGNDKKMLKSFYVFDDISEIRIEKEALTFGEKHQGMGRLGITLKDLNGNFKSISWFNYSTQKWYSEGAVFPESFFFHIASWQLINSMDSVAKVHISETRLNELIGDRLRLFSNEKKYVKGCNMLSIYGDDIIGCYLKEDEELYLASPKGDMALELIEECLKLDLDWL